MEVSERDKSWSIHEKRSGQERSEKRTNGGKGSGPRTYVNPKPVLLPLLSQLRHLISILLVVGDNSTPVREA